MGAQQMRVGKIIWTGLIASIFLTFVLSARPTSATALSSQFLSTDANAAQVMAGTPYDMNDPLWTVAGRQNRNIFAYKIYSALFMLGYQTQTYRSGGDQVNVLKAFQSHNGLPVSNVFDSTCLALLDQQLVQREALLATIAAGLQPSLHNHMQTLNANDVSASTVASIFALAFRALPASLQMLDYEAVQCASGQCVGWIKDAGGVNDAPYPVDLSSNYLFVANYFDPLVSNAFMPSATVLTATVLHEYGHYLDGVGLGWIKSDPVWGPVYSLQPLVGSIPNAGFHDITYDMSTGSHGCYTRRSADIKDWISKYGFTNYGDGNCPAGKGVLWEEWAESFAMYVTAGRDFRAAAVQSTMVARKYNWLKTNVFNGLEYDTAIPQGANSGCNDIASMSAQQPGYVHCDPDYIWDFTLPHGLVNGACGAAGGGTYLSAPTANLCATGSFSAVSNTGAWNWSCNGLNGGSAASCTANILTGTPPGAPGMVTAIGGSTQASVTFTAPAIIGSSAITGYTAIANPPGGIDANAGTAALTHTVTGLTNDTVYTFTVTARNQFGDGPASAASNSVTPTWSVVAENFDDVAPPALPPNWQTLVQIQSAGAWATSAGSHFPANIAAHSPSGLAYFNAHAAGANQSARLVTPAFSLSGISGAKLSFWMYRDGDAGSAWNVSDKVDVYISSPLSTPHMSGEVQIGTTLHRSRWLSPSVGAAGWYHYVFDIPSSFSGSNNYIMFLGYGPGGGNDIHLDDIVVAIPPDAPTMGTATGGNAQATVTFTAPLNNGGSPVTGYAVSSSPAGGVDSNAGSTGLSHIVTGLTNGIAYTFSVAASNAVGSGAASAASNSVTPMTLPGAPVIGAATGGNAQATVTFAAPASNGGDTIVGYVVTSSPAGGVDTNFETTALTHTVIGLTNGTAYTFRVTATNSAGVSPPSAASNSVTPARPATITSLSSSTNPSVFGQSTTFTATVSGSSPGGTVSFYDGATLVCGPIGLTGTQAQCPVDTLSVNSHDLSAAYSGDANNAGSTSATITQIVDRANTGTTLDSVITSPAYVGRAVTVSAGVLPAAPGAGMPSGTITVSDGSANCRIDVSQASQCDLTPQTAGVKTLSATYGGDGNFNGSNSAGVGLSVSSPTAPGAPVISAVTPGNGKAMVSFTAPASDGGSDITGYTAACAPTAGGAALSAGAGRAPVSVGGLVNGAAYTCAVTAANIAGSGPVSAALPVTPGLRAARVAIAAHTPDPSLAGAPILVQVAAGPAVPALGAVSSGAHTCLLDGAGGVQCWGRNNAGQLGDGSMIDRPVPVAVPGLASGATAVATGQNHSCALVSGGVRCWGDNSGGQLGADPAATPQSAAPRVVPGLAGIVALAAGGDSTCALSVAGSVQCWGDNVAGQLGNGQAITNNPTPTPTPVTVDFGGVALTSGVVAIGGGNFHRCAIDGAGHVFCWGWNNAGQLGDGTLTPRPAPVAVSMPPEFSGAVEVSTGLQHTCALTGGGAVWCWGGNFDGELGDGGTSSFSTVPVASAGLSAGVVALATGMEHTCALDAAGTVSCWGPDYFGETGGMGAPVPTPVPGLGATVTAVAAGDTHSCAATADGGVLCWGGNNYGQLGDGSSTDRSNPGYVVGFEIPTGTITVGDGAASCPITLPATRCNLTPATAGAKTLAASYGGDAVFSAGISTGVRHTVSLASSTTSLGASVNPSVFGQSVTFTASVTGNAPSGLVSFKDGSSVLCAAAPLANGQASCMTGALGVGAHGISAVYAGDGHNAGSTFATLPQAVNKAGTSISIASHTPNPSAAGAPIAVTIGLAVTAPGAGTPTGTITVGDGSAICVIVLPLTGCNLAPGNAGARTLTAVYGGDGSFSNSISAGAGHTVDPGPGSTTLSSSANPSVAGHAVTFTASVAGTSPSGTVNFRDGAASIGGCIAQPVGGGHASCSTSALTLGTHPISAVYSGDASNPGGISPTLIQTVRSRAPPDISAWLMLLLSD